ncbi:hypothetical protein [Marinobacter qingdaonensis]|uniref:Uncharacterized protein n=1 Tax=Marinobacter qingdaonensis TaxID=3108486 RepID=A0ABU5NUT7_9GAMM|nr:hypothetical protein [Marinobacter sp. ASW11-75]MEA1079527.1 hypothetical protein [Marinobacter sp. ASW11-75]
MALPATMQILDEIEARLKQITKANGYSVDLMKLERARLTPFQSGEMPCINYWPESDQLVETLPSKHLRELSLNVEFYDTSGRSAALTDKAALLANDAYTALWRSPDLPLVSDRPDPNLGGIVDSLVLQSIQPAIGEGQNPFCGAVMSIAVRYRIDPHTLTALA